MGLTVSESKGDFVIAPEGNHLARCYRVIDIGTQKVTWQGVEKAQKKVMIVWELHGDGPDGKPMVTDDGRPLVVSRRFTPTLSAKGALRALLVSWRGRQFTEEELHGFKLQNILGAWCMLTIAHEARNGKTYANIVGASAVPSAMKKLGMPEPVNPEVWFDIDEPDMEVFDAFPDYLKEIIAETPEWKMKDSGFKENSPAPGDDDIPF